MTRDQEITACAMALMSLYEDEDDLSAYFAEQTARTDRERNWPAQLVLLDVAAKVDEIRKGTMQ